MVSENIVLLQVFLLLTGVSNSGAPYGSLYTPNEFGSAGGGHTSIAGRGGGRIWVNVTNTLHIDGLVSSNGGDGSKSSDYIAGGGSGGSIWIYTNVIKGYGNVEANGGDGSYYSYHSTQRGGGGGSGGRIALYFQVGTLCFHKALYFQQVYDIYLHGLKLSGSIQYIYTWRGTF